MLILKGDLDSNTLFVKLKDNNYIVNHKFLSEWSNLDYLDLSISKDKIVAELLKTILSEKKIEYAIVVKKPSFDETVRVFMSSIGLLLMIGFDSDEVTKLLYNKYNSGILRKMGLDYNKLRKVVKITEGQLMFSIGDVVTSARYRGLFQDTEVLKILTNSENIIDMYKFIFFNGLNSKSNLSFNISFISVFEDIFDYVSVLSGMVYSSKNSIISVNWVNGLPVLGKVYDISNAERTSVRAFNPIIRAFDGLVIVPTLRESLIFHDGSVKFHFVSTYDVDVLNKFIVVTKSSLSRANVSINSYRWFRKGGKVYEKKVLFTLPLVINGELVISVFDVLNREVFFLPVKESVSGTYFLLDFDCGKDIYLDIEYDNTFGDVYMYFKLE